MSNENGSPCEFLDVEARLSALAPMPSRVDRDTLLYRAGFAAAKSQAARRRWIPPVTTVAAVVVAVVVTHTVSTASHQAPRPDAGEVATPSAPESEVAFPFAEVAKEETPWRQTATRDKHCQYRFNPETAPLLAARERALAMDFDEWPHVVSDTVSPSRPAATIRQLQEEFLPRGKDGSPSKGMFPSHWLQPRTRNGEST